MATKNSIQWILPFQLERSNLGDTNLLLRMSQLSSVVCTGHQIWKMSKLYVQAIFARIFFFVCQEIIFKLFFLT